MANLLEVGLLKLYADHALLANITQTSAAKLTLDLAPVGVKKFNAPMILKALDAAGLDATFETTDKKTAIKLTLQPAQQPELLAKLQKLCFNLMAEIDNKPQIEETVDEK